MAFVRRATVLVRSSLCAMIQTACEYPQCRYHPAHKHAPEDQDKTCDQLNCWKGPYVVAYLFKSYLSDPFYKLLRPSSSCVV